LPSSIEIRRKLSAQEMALVDAQKKAQECWWNGGFIAPQEKK